MSFPPTLGITSPFIIYSRPSPVFQEFQSILLPTIQELHSQFSTTTKMNGYSRIRKINSARSKSVDLTDLSFTNHTPKTTQNHFNSNLKSQQTTPNHSTTEKNAKTHDGIPEKGNEDAAGEAFGVILSRKFPTPSAPSYKVMADQQGGTSFQINVGKKSVRRSVSVSEGYCRIHHQLDLTTAEEDDQKEDECNNNNNQKLYIKKRGKFLKACRRLFGL